jgi:hypothetical protein
VAISDEKLASIIQLEAGTIPFSHPEVDMDERELGARIASSSLLESSLADARSRDGELDSEAYISARLKAHTLRLADAGDPEALALVRSSNAARAHKNAPRIGR